MPVIKKFSTVVAPLTPTFEKLVEMATDAAAAADAAENTKILPGGLLITIAVVGMSTLCFGCYILFKKIQASQEMMAIEKEKLIFEQEKLIFEQEKHKDSMQLDQEKHKDSMQLDQEKHKDSMQLEREKHKDSMQLEREKQKDFMKLELKKLDLELYKIKVQQAKLGTPLEGIQDERTMLKVEEKKKIRQQKRPTVASDNPIGESDVSNGTESESEYISSGSPPQNSPDLIELGPLARESLH